jgi:hypothetical protein
MDATSSAGGPSGKRRAGGYFTAPAVSPET